MDPHQGKFKKNTVVLDSSQYNSNIGAQTQSLIDKSLAKANQLEKLTNNVKSISSNTKTNSKASIQKMTLGKEQHFDRIEEMKSSMEQTPQTKVSPK